jgi:sugar phosphate isomerase/epimerase
MAGRAQHRLQPESIWRRIFEEWGDAVGMNFDPSHLVWQMIDQTRFIKEFGPRMAHVHAKDLYDRPRRAL